MGMCECVCMYDLSHDYSFDLNKKKHTLRRTLFIIEMIYVV